MNIFRKKVYINESIELYVQKHIVENKSLTPVTKKTSSRLFRLLKSSFKNSDTVNKLNFCKIEAIVDQWRKNKIQPATIRQRLGALRRCIGYWYAMGCIDKMIPTPKIESVPKREVYTYSIEDYKAIMKSIKREMAISNYQYGFIYSMRALNAEKLYYSIRVLAETAMRPTEFLRLRYADIDFKENRILIRAFSKRKGESRTVMVSEKLIQELRAFRGTTNNSAYVSPYYDRELDVDEQQQKFFRNFVSLCKRNNLVFAGNKMKVRQFRASTAQWLLNEGVSEQYVSSYLGHSHPETLRLYTNSQTILDKRTKDIRKLKRIKLFK